MSRGRGLPRRARSRWPGLLGAVGGQVEGRSPAAHTHPSCSSPAHGAHTSALPVPTRDPVRPGGPRCRESRAAPGGTLRKPPRQVRCCLSTIHSSLCSHPERRNVNINSTDGRSHASGQRTHGEMLGVPPCPRTAGQNPGDIPPRSHLSERPVSKRQENSKCGPGRGEREPRAQAAVGTARPPSGSGRGAAWCGKSPSGRLAR